MRLLLCFALAFSLTGCAFQGTIVEKQSRPHSLYHSVGIEGVYTFVLRDNTGAVNQQMVTPDVFEAYAVGDYFSDMQAPPNHDDAKNVRTARPQTEPGVTLPPYFSNHQPTLEGQRQVIVAKVAPTTSVTTNTTKAAPAQGAAKTNTTTAAAHVAKKSTSSTTSKHVASHKSSSATKKKSVAQHSKSSSAKKKIASAKSSKKRSVAKNKTRKPFKVTAPTSEPNGPSVDVRTANGAGPTPIPVDDTQAQPAPTPH